ncbi:MAG TPA: DsbA family oxidoreductase [Steroidobacteraceae bacterium]
MNAIVPYFVKSAPPQLEIDLVADFSCPWSYLGKRRLERALEALQGPGAPIVRWHTLRMVPTAATSSVPWQAHLETRLPPGITAEFAERSLAEAGREFGITFNFNRLATMPETVEAHRLVRLAARDGRQSATAEAIFRAFFEQGRDIGAVAELAKIGEECGLSADVLSAFRDTAQERDAVDRDEMRLKGFGVAAVPNLLLNGRILVSGAVDVPTYVQAIDQAIFPQPPEESPQPTRH